ncbi:MAG: ABC transporter substrate-binding protein [Gammaproteobacteria bacterium]|nr:ABC transporter substrate-binding protein [Gammaproteobacteria bacterium]
MKTGIPDILFFPKKIILLALLFIGFLLTLTACSDSSSPALRFALSSAPVTLDPRFATDATSSRINRLIYRRLVDFDEQSLPKPDLATWKQLSPKHYRFKLSENDGRTFHDGSYLSSADVQATYDSLLDKKNASPHQGSLSNIERIETPDDETIDFYLKEPDPLFPGKLTIGILPAHAITSNHPFQSQPIGSGPFALSNWTYEGKLQLTRVSDQQTLEFLHVKDPTVRVLKLLRGEVDMLQSNLSPELVNYLREKPDFKVLQTKGSNFTYLGFNMEDPQVGQHSVRKAIAYAIDRDSIIKYIWGGAAHPANALLPPAHWAGNSQLSSYQHNPNTARQLLKQAGFTKDNPLKITYKTSSDPFRIRLATIIQSQLAEVGIEVKIRSYDWGSFYGDIKAGRFQLYSLSWVGIKSPDIFQYIFHSSMIPPSGANRGRYISPVADQLIDAANVATDRGEQAQKYQQLQAHVFEELPYIPLWYEDHIFIAKANIIGYTLATDGNYDGLINTTKE